MRLTWLLVPLAMLALTACVSVERQPQPSATVVTPAPSSPALVAPPGTAIITHP